MLCIDDVFYLHELFRVFGVPTGILFVDSAGWADLLINFLAKPLQLLDVNVLGFL